MTPDDTNVQAEVVIPTPRRLLEGGGSRWLRSRNAGIAIFVTAIFVAYGLWLVVMGDRSPLPIVLDSGTWLVDIICIASAAVLSRRRELPERTRRAWRFCMYAFFALMLGDSIWIIFNVIGVQPMASVADVTYLLFYLSLLAGIFLFSGVDHADVSGHKLVLDVLLVVIAGGTVLWYLILGPTVQTNYKASIDGVLAVGYPLFDFVALSAVSIVLLMRPPAVNRTTIRLFGVASFARLLSSLAFGHEAVSTGGFVAGRWTVMGWVFASVLWVWAAQYQLWRISHAPAIAALDDEQTASSRSFIPYLALAVGYGLLIVVSRPYWSSSIAVGIAAAFVMTVIVTVRQWMGVNENARLVAEQLSREARFRSLVQNSSDVIAVIDEDNIIRFMSPAVKRVLGWSVEDAVGKSVFDVVHRDDVPSVTTLVERIRNHPGESASDVWRCRNSAGEWRYIETVVTCLTHDPAVHGIVLNTRDVSERMLLQQELTHQAYHDPLTHLANRAWFYAQVDRALTRAQQTPEHVAVFFLDLDNFKNVNDTVGHTEGDRMLQLVAERLLNATRGSDTVARLGGDEFAVLVERISSTESLTIVADRITNAMRLPFKLDSGEVFSGASTGIARGAPDEGVDALLRNADVAMYVSKRQGKGAYTMFEPRMHQAAQERVGLETDLRIAVERQQFHLLYQPVVTLADHRAVGVEALVRWDHPERGVLPPAEFIGAAEESGLILPLGRWVLKEACTQGARWHAMLPANTPFTVAVNVSRRQLQHTRFVEDVAVILRETGFPPSSLVLEITESVIMLDVDAMAHRLRVLRSLGVKIAIDDFGTGYSSLGALRQFPVDVLKIDKSFIDGAAAGDRNTALARTIVALGATLSLETVAEGVEQEDQAQALQAMGCVVAQGFHFAYPLHPSEIDDIVRDTTTPLGHGTPALALSSRNRPAA